MPFVKSLLYVLCQITFLDSVTCEEVDWLLFLSLLLFLFVIRLTLVVLN